MNKQPTPVTVVITCAIKPQMVDIARQELEAVIKTVMANESACHGIRVLVDSKAPHRLLIIEQWDSEEVFSGPHMQTPHMQAFLRTAQTFLEGAADFGFWREELVAA